MAWYRLAPTSGGGIFIGDSSQNRDNVVGGLEKSQGNVVSGQGSQSIILQSGTNNQILGNKIGTDVTGANIIGAPIGFASHSLTVQWIRPLLPIQLFKVIPSEGAVPYLF